ncbi:MAG TPA: hypothetical protein VFQ61_34135 [Polyangiaceae bacterium]|nr:hypothetical protein [Polyangiaceae bacterium]
MRIYQLAVSIVALGLFACSEEVESTDVRTSGVYPVITVTADGSGSSRVDIELKVGGSSSNTRLDLEGEDNLTVTVGDETRRITESKNNKYTTTFDTDAEGTEFIVAFNRGADDKSAPNSRVSLPAPFDLTLGSSEVSRKDDVLDFTWDKAGGPDMEWHADGDCIFPESDTTADDGEASIGAGKLDATSSKENESCEVTLSLTRTAKGTADPAFTEGGAVKALQVRSETFQSLP